MQCLRGSSCRPPIQQLSFSDGGFFDGPCAFQVREARGLPLEERLAACTAMKLKGNEQMSEGHPDNACETYEKVSPHSKQ